MLPGCHGTRCRHIAGLHALRFGIAVKLWAKDAQLQLGGREESHWPWCKNQWPTGLEYTIQVIGCARIRFCILGSLGFTLRITLPIAWVCFSPLQSAIASPFWEAWSYTFMNAKVRCKRWPFVIVAWQCLVARPVAASKTLVYKCLNIFEPQTVD